MALLRSRRDSTVAIQAKLYQMQQALPKTHEIKKTEVQYMRELDHGKSAVVWLGSYKNHEVVIKEYKFNEKFPDKPLEMLVKEWKVMSATFSSPFVVKPVAYCQKPLLLAMEYIKKGALDNVMDNYDLTFEQKIVIACDVTSGLLALLNAGIVYRDIKSANILITDDFRAKICDFNLSSIVDDKESYRSVGTLDYIAPECCYRNSEVSLPKADVYSFGILLLELFIDENVFFEYCKLSGENTKFSDLAECDARSKKVQDIIKYHVGHLPMKLQSIISDCLNVDPNKRPIMRTVQQRLNNILEKTNELSQCPRLCSMM